MRQILFGMLQNSNVVSLNMSDCERRHVSGLLLKIKQSPPIFCTSVPYFHISSVSLFIKSLMLTSMFLSVCFSDYQTCPNHRIVC